MGEVWRGVEGSVEREEDRAWEYLRHLPQDPEYPFHSLRWERRSSRGLLPLEEQRLAPVETPDLLEVAARLAREAKLCERESAIFRRFVEGFSQAESARCLTLRKATVGAIWRQVRARLAHVIEETAR